MKIESSPDSSYIGSVAGGPQKAAEQPVAGTAAATGQPQAGVTVTLSPSTVSAMGPGSGGEVFNAEKVESFKQAIANGTFQVNAEAIADKMLANAAEMLRGARA